MTVNSVRFGTEKCLIILFWMFYREPKLKVTPLILLVGVTICFNCCYMIITGQGCATPCLWGWGLKWEGDCSLYLSPQSPICWEGVWSSDQKGGVWGGLCLVVEIDPFIGFEGKGQSAQWTAFVSGKEDMKTKTGSGYKRHPGELWWTCTSTMD